MPSLTRWATGAIVIVAFMAVSSYRDLILWQKGVALVTDIYRLTRTFPRDEMYGLTSQMRRAGVSIPANIAEGQGRLSTGEFKHFLGQARGSMFELESHALIARNLGYSPTKTQEPLSNESTSWADS